TPTEMQMAEQAVFAQGQVGPEDLMEKAGLGIAHALRERWPHPGKAIAYLGKGHNAGDALVVGRHLRHWGWHVTLRDAVSSETASPLTRKKRAEFLATPETPSDHLRGPHVLIDGLLGNGACGPLRHGYQKLAREMNVQRTTEGAYVVAIDLPSGLDGESGIASEDAVRADLTLTIAYAKTGLLADQATAHVGTLALIPLPEIPPPPNGLGDATAQVLTAELLS
ncbi:MAG: NAD(P)H-hydrate epimerase, partial [Verrucomicrobiales bacterium]